MEGFEYTALHITQHKRFMSFGTHPNFYFAKTSFMPETLSEIACMFKGKNNMSCAPLRIWSDRKL